MNYYQLFNHPIAIKERGCNHDDCPGAPIPPSVNLFVKVTNGCNAHCLFCSNADAPHTGEFDINKLFRIIEEIKKRGIILNRLNITGGEPSLVKNRVIGVLERMDLEGHKDVHVHLNTNGLISASQQLMSHPRWDSISVSLHHYDNDKLSQLYGIRIPEEALNFDGIDMMKVNASCNLIRGYIDCTDEAHKMMDFCIEKGFTRLGFVGLMPVNNFCKIRLVKLDELQLQEIPHCYFTECKNRGGNCKCSNYLYNKNLKVLDIYMRHYVNPQYCESGLMFDGEYLCQGFNDNNIIY